MGTKAMNRSENPRSFALSSSGFAVRTSPLPPGPLVSVVLLSYNRPHYFQEALSALLDQTYQNLEVLVVDNPSPGSAEVARIAGRHPQVRLIQADRNLGYTGGMNKGIEEATGDYLFLTEDDIVLDPACVETLVDYGREHPASGLMAPIIHNKTSGTIRCAGGEFDLGAIYRMKIHGAGEADNGQFPEPFSVGYIDGAVMFASRRFWKTFGGFREEYFMYVDAVELCARILKAGEKMTVVPDARVFHFEPDAEAVSSEIEFHKVKNFFSLYLLHASVRHLPEFLLRYVLFNGARAVLTTNNGSGRGPFLRALWWVALKTPSLLRERLRGASK